MRKAKLKRRTRETEIAIELNIDGSGIARIITQIPFLDHMLEAFAKYSLIDLALKAKGDIEVDQHHTIEDIGLALGKAISKALKNRLSINRSGFSFMQMDDALVLSVIDLSGRPYLIYKAEFKRRYCGRLDTDLLEDFLYALSTGLGANITVKQFSAKSDHHLLEAIFKSLGKSLLTAASKNKRNKIPSTKGLLDI
jgi:imidazoleglycerol-phosphate dehydratase